MNEPTDEEKLATSQEGYKAYPGGNNPYAADNPLYGYWSTGWRKAQYDKVVGDVRAVTYEPSNWPTTPGFSKNRNRRPGNMMR